MSKREYIIANRKWLEDKAKEEGVKALPNGIYYKVLKSGDPDGPSTARNSTQALAVHRLPCDSAT